MKTEFELNLDNDGRPCIRFKHHDKDNSLEQKTLKAFIDGVKKNGCILCSPSSYAEIGTGVSWTKYEIRIKPENP